MKKLLRTHGFTLIELLVVITIIAILASIALPVYGTIQEKGLQTKALAQGKQVGLGLRLFASDNDGNYPKAGQKYDDDTNMGTTTSNDFLKALIPTYVPSENVFYVGKSKWSTNKPDENTATVAVRLAAGENHWAYTRNLTDTSNPRFPLIADGFTTTVGTYSTDETLPGGTWKGKKAVVLRNDQSAELMVCTLSGNTSIVKDSVGSGNTTANIFTPVAGWLSSAGGQTAVNPLAP